MKVAYIAHPISGDIKGNLKKIEAIVRQINLEEPEVVPFAHYFLDCHCLDDDDALERARGIKNDVALMHKGFIDEIRLYGDRISIGMHHEVCLAMELGIKVIPMTKETSAEFIEKWSHLPLRASKPILINWYKLRDDFFNECVDESSEGGTYSVSLAAHDMFEWIKSRIIESMNKDKN